LRALSFEIGAAKPEAAHFEAALALAGARAEEAFYADDRPELVAAARSLGIDAFVVSGPDDLAGTLQRRGLLSRETPGRFSGGASLRR
jgi:putative hydrolase of the HAD superfamily